MAGMSGETALMEKRISRRKLIKGGMLLGGSLLLSPQSRDACVAADTGNGTMETGPAPLSHDDIARAYERLDDYANSPRPPVYKSRIEPHWFGERFWYRNDLPHGTTEFVLVDAARGTRNTAFDHGKLAAALSARSHTAVDGKRLPFHTIAFTGDAGAVSFAVDGVHWQCDLSDYTLAQLPETPPAAATPQAHAPEAPPDDGALRSPDGKSSVIIRDGNIVVKSEGGGEKVLTTDGTGERPYGEPQWSPDSGSLVAYRIDPIPIKPVYMVESSPADGGTRGVLHQHEYAQPGDPFSKYEMWIFDVAAGTGVKAHIDTIDYGGAPDLHWRPDNRRFLFERTDRGHQRFRIVEVDAHSGASRNIVDERSETFINTSNSYVHYTGDLSELIMVSEQDGWRHLYLFDTEAGMLKNQITKGEYVVRSVDHVDEPARVLWFQASGMNRGEDPYHLHSYRINFDGSGLTEITDGNGTHSVSLSPDRKYAIDTYSRADLAPAHTLRRTADGSLCCDLETADTSELEKSGWKAPEVFTAKGRDGHTDIWGIVFRPSHFSHRKRYPVIENIYAGPQDSFVRKSFSVRDSMQELAELGFIVVQCDGMGTRNRSKAFHDVCWRNIKDAGLPDRIAWIKAFAAKYDYVDASRVGIYGTSAGGQNSTGALLFHPEFYKAAVSSCGCHDNRIDKQWWNEQWMGYPLGPWYADNSNITHAANLRGKLFLMVGELDSNVPPESTLRLADALIKAEKDFDLLVLPGMDHTGGGSYGDRKRQDFFVRHLLGAEPPDRNTPRAKPAPVMLPGKPVAEAGSAQSEGGADTTILFRNGSQATVRLFWVSDPGHRTQYGTLKPGDERLQHTYTGHTWLVVADDGTEWMVYVADRKPGIALIRQPKSH